jgi:tRNA uridine 5-carboxymethylaminomethyl modification enzyme
VEEEAAIEIKYQGYIEKQKAQVARQEKLESRLIPKEFDYQKVKSLSAEAKEKLAEVKPHSIGQAGRISGVSPADIAILLVSLEQFNRTSLDLDKEAITKKVRV